MGGGLTIRIRNFFAFRAFMRFCVILKKPKIFALMRNFCGPDPQKGFDFGGFDKQMRIIRFSVHYLRF